MVDIKKGLRIAKQLQEKFKFNDRGESKFGDSQDSSHLLRGETKIYNTINLDGNIEMQQRLAGALFGVPQVPGNTTDGDAALQDLKDNASSNYEGFIIYLTTASSISPFLDDEKFYFCENGVWYPSPFLKDDGTQVVADTDSDNDGNPDSQDPFITETPSAGVTNTILNPVNFQNDPIFELDSSGNILLTAASAGVTNGNFEVDANGNIVLVA